MEKRSLAIIQRNNNVCTRTLGQKLIMFSTVGWRTELHDRISTHFFSVSPLSKDSASVWGWTENEPYGIALFKFLYSLTWAFVCNCSVSSHCSRVISYRLCVKKSSRAERDHFRPIFSTNWHRQKSHIAHLENSSKVWQKTYKWLVKAVPMNGAQTRQCVQR